MFGWWDLRLDQRPLLFGQVRWVAQLVAVVAGAVLGRPHPALAKQAPWTESQVIRAAQAHPATDSNDSHSFRTDGVIGVSSRRFRWLLLSRMIERGPVVHRPQSIEEEQLRDSLPVWT